MLLLELATQAVKGFSPSSRSALRTGYNVLVPPAGTAPAVIPLLTSLLYPDGRPADAALCAGQTTGRAGLTLQGNDGATYRLVHALGGGYALHRHDPSANGWVIVGQDTGEIGARLREVLKLPSRAQFEELFCTGAQGLPSRRAGGGAGEGAMGGVGGGGSGGAPISATNTPKAVAALRPTALVEAAMAAATPRPSRLDSAAARARIEQLEAEVATGRQMEDQQFKVEGMHRRIFELEEQLKRVDKLIANVETARAATQTGPSLESLSLPADALERAARYDDAVRRRDEAALKVREEVLDAQERVAAAQPRPLWHQREFWLGLGLGLAALAIGFVFRGKSAGYLALLDVPAFGYVGLVALRWIGDLQAVEALQRKRALSEDREKALNANFDAEFFGIKAAIRVVGVDSGLELVERIEARQRAEKALRGAEQRLEAARADPSLLSALDEQERLKVEVKQLEATLGEHGLASLRDWREAERELMELKGGGGAETVGGAAGASGAPAAGGKDDPTPRLLSLAQELFGNASLEALGAMVRDRATQYLAALSDRRYQAVEIDARGQATLSAAGGRKVAASAIDDADLDLLYLAVKLTLLEKQAPLRKVPLVFDEPFVGFDEAKLQLVSRMLKHIGTATQVLHATALPAHVGLADAASRL